eukprot:scaffold6771_cov158-Amphora_coffeaeformis.AAC.5
MGNSVSNLTKEQKRQREQEKLLRQHGVLLPPVFAIGLDQNHATTCWVDSPSRIEARHYESLINNSSSSSSSSLPSSLSRVWLAQQEDPSYRILQDYMTPGLWFQSVSNEATVLASLLYEINIPKQEVTTTTTTTDTKKLERTIGSRQGRLLVGRSLGEDQQVNVRLQGGTDGLPRLASQIRINDTLSMGMSTNQEGQGWLSANLDARVGKADDGKVQVEAASVLAWDLQNLQQKNNDDTSLLSKMHLTGSVGTGRNGWKLAADTKVNLGTLQTEDTRLFGTMTLQDGTLLPSDAISPVQLSLELNEKVSAVAITQRIAFDRLNFNLTDDRCPSVRNTVGWTLRMEQPMPSASPSEDDKLAPKVTVGGVWQLNRAIAVKATIQDENVTGALLCRRWKHPRVTCSILGRYHWPTQTRSWLGIGLEIETGRLVGTNSDEDILSKSSETIPVVSIPGNAPPTRAKLPTYAIPRA